ncbi:hypothetical protein HPB47_005837 [Ixodes persulcatus]|uniref:Uncharacterized protein n=1 Tax=Ixodes persulcatus TaxID=34615 RepID=A0AC60PCA2_IXOPE|nr:hypothetical protein HPB47_005837 [Ixodes persulcatus]
MDTSPGVSLFAIKAPGICPALRSLASSPALGENKTAGSSTDDDSTARWHALAQWLLEPLDGYGTDSQIFGAVAVRMECQLKDRYHLEEKTGL